MTKILAPLLLVLCISAYAQYDFHPDEEYLRLSTHAMKLYLEQNYGPAALTYDSLFKSSKGKGEMVDFFLGAISWIKVGNLDKAFPLLKQGLARYGVVSIEGLNSDPDFASLHSDKRWQSLLEEVRAWNKTKEAKLNRPVMAMLDSIYTKDQGDRLKLDSIQLKFGNTSKEASVLWSKVMKQDSANVLAVKGIINKYGWLGPDEVGEQGATTIFLVIQHADPLTQVTYLPLMRDAVKKGMARASNLALLEDRVLIRQGKDQIYGSQINTDSTGGNSFYPIMDEENVNKRRIKMGLGPLEEYARMFGIEYQVPKSKKGREK